MRAQEFIAEAFDQPYKMKWEKSDYGDIDALVTLPDGTYLTIMFEHTTPYEVNISFWRNNSLDVTGEGDAQRIFATVLAAIQKFLTKEQPANISFSASKEVEPGQNSESRAKLYNRMVQRYAAAWGYTPHSFDHGDEVKYELSRIKQGVAEEQLDELSFLGSQCTKDCSGHRAGYEWSKRKGLRQANSWSPSFNKGAGLAVAGK
jgi:effector-binding domain-containing protein